MLTYFFLENFIRQSGIGTNKNHKFLKIYESIQHLNYFANLDKIWLKYVECEHVLSLKYQLSILNRSREIHVSPIALRTDGRINGLTTLIVE